MNIPYVPTEDEVRSKFAAWYGDNEYRDIPEVWFDRFLANVKAEAWDEGHADGQHNEHEFREGRRITNPYRIEDAA